jgi:DNA-binding LacI/PurR family transcriptional regulator
MVNNVGGAFEATHSLIELGHRRIAIITGATGYLNRC